MQIWVVTSSPANYSFLDLHYNVSYFTDYKKASKWFLCADIARPDFVIFEYEVSGTRFFDFQKTDGIDDCLRLVLFTLVLPLDDIDLLRKGYSVGAEAVTIAPINPSASRAFMENRFQRREAQDLPIQNCFKGMGVDFTPTEDKMLFVFSRMKDFRARADSLRKGLWGEQRVSDKNLDVHVTNLRGKLKKLGYGISRIDGDFVLHKASLIDDTKQAQRRTFAEL